jgi:hypothetical protein
MRLQRSHQIRFPQSEGRMSPLERLAESFVLERDDSNAERTGQMREAYFADVAALLESGELRIP